MRWNVGGEAGGRSQQQSSHRERRGIVGFHTKEHARDQASGGQGRGQAQRRADYQHDGNLAQHQPDHRAGLRAQRFDDGSVRFAADLRDNIAAGDVNYLSLLDEADAYVARNGLDFPEEPQARVFGPDPDCVTSPLLELDLDAAGVTSIIWATGYATDFGWLKVDAFDEGQAAAPARRVERARRLLPRAALAFPARVELHLGRMARRQVHRRPDLHPARLRRLRPLSLPRRIAQAQGLPGRRATGSERRRWNTRPFGMMGLLSLIFSVHTLG